MLFYHLTETAVYIGESASLAFLQTVQSAVTAAIGPCPFIHDPGSHLMIESTTELYLEAAREVDLDHAVVLSLAEEFFVATSGILDLFDPSWLINEVSVWINYPSQRSKPKSAVFNLALAIGAQGRAQDDSDQFLAEHCFSYGRKLAMFTLMDDLSLSTVQAFVLATYYMIAACRRNAAFTNLGIAVRAAYTLGIHLHEANASLAEEGMCRERAWKSLRVCDLFLSASLGRPPATSETTCSIPWTSFDPTISEESSRVKSQTSSAMFRVCNIIEQILVEVYSKKAITVEMANSISSKHRQWAEALPLTLTIDCLEEKDDASHSGKHGARIVKMAYYYSIILLTKPFLTFMVRSSKKDSQKQDSLSIKADLITYADACVISAMKGIDVAYDDIFHHRAPRRQPLVVNSVFISALCVGLAYLGDYDQQGWPLCPSIERGIAILSHLGQISPQSACYADICRSLKGAATTYVLKRDDSLFHLRSESVRSVFGDVPSLLGSQAAIQEISSTIANPPLSALQLPRKSVAPELASPCSFDADDFQQDFMIPISDISLGHLTSASHDHCYDNCDDEVPTQQYSTENAPDRLYNFYFGQDNSLFGLTDDIESGIHF